MRGYLVSSRWAERRYLLPLFCSWLRTLSIRSLGIRSRPLNGRSSSKIKKIAVATATADTIKANVAVALHGAISVKLRKMITSQNDTTINRGFRNGRDRFCNQQRAKLSKLQCECRSLSFEAALHLIVWSKSLNGHIDRITGLRVGSQF